MGQGLYFFRAVQGDACHVRPLQHLKVVPIVPYAYYTAPGKGGKCAQGFHSAALVCAVGQKLYVFGVRQYVGCSGHYVEFILEAAFCYEFPGIVEILLRTQKKRLEPWPVRYVINLTEGGRCISTNGLYERFSGVT